jgi:hypothetical protein
LAGGHLVKTRSGTDSSSGWFRPAVNGGTLLYPYRTMHSEAISRRTEAYYHELMDRYNRGELNKPDSALLPDASSTAHPEGKLCMVAVASCPTFSFLWTLELLHGLPRSEARD